MRHEPGAMHRPLIAAAVILTIAGGAAAQPEPPPEPDGGGVVPAPRVPDEPEAVLTFMQMGNRFQIQAAREAMDRAEDERVRRFAERLWRDHRLGAERVAQQAQQLGVELAAPEAPPQMMQRMMQTLQTASGPAFDRIYLEVVARLHRGMIGALGRIEGDLEHPAVVSLLNEQGPILGQHLELAEILRREEGGRQP